MRGVKIRARILAVVAICAGVSASQAQVEWSRHPSNPVLPHGLPASWDPTTALATTVMFHEGLYKMWYEGDGGFGYATSSDGVLWSRHGANPVLRPGNPPSWDESGISHASVLFADGLYRMWYSGVDAFGKNRIGYATSANGIAWSPHAGNPVLGLGPPGSYDDEEVIHPSVLFAGALYCMWYNGHDGSTQRVLCATSPNGVTWTRFTERPMLEPGAAGSWDDAELGPLCVLVSAGMHHMWYTGWNQSAQFAIGHATSPDGLAWQKTTWLNPVLQPGDPGSWDASLVGVPNVILQGGQFRMWYGGSEGSTYQTGLATAPDVTEVAGSGRAQGPAPCALLHGAPSPFHAGTTIRYRVTAPTPLRLEILDAAGRRVRTLVASQEAEVGLHAIPWSGRDHEGREVRAGIYFLRLTAPGLVQSRRLILMR